MSFEAYDASSAQKRLYLIDELQGKNILYNMPSCWIIKGHLQPQRLETAIKKLIQRHETLRTSFAAKDGQVFQKVHQHLDFQLKYRKIDEDLAENIDSIIDDFVHPFDLANIPLWRIELMQLTPDSQLLLLDIHHIIFDGVSMCVLINDLMTFYSGKELPGLEYQYVDFTTWQNQQWESAKIKRQEQYWLTVFTGELPVLEMPVDYPRSSLPQIRGDSIEFNLDTKLTKKVKQMAVKYNTGLYVLLLTLYTILLHKYSGQEDIVVGTPAAGRTHREFELIIGMFVNTLAMRNQPSGDKKFIDFLEQVSKNIFSALENQDYPFEMLVDKLLPQRHLNRNPLFDTLFALQNFPRNLEVSAPGQNNLKCVPYEVKEKAAKFDIELAALEKETQIEFRLQYRTSLYRKETMRRFLHHFVRMINEVVNNPLQGISDIEVISEEEREYLLYTLNATTNTYPKDKTIHQLFEKQVEITPNNIALVGSHQTPKKHEKNHQLPHSSHMSYMSYMSYIELNKKSNQLAHLLRENGVQPETIVSLIVERSLEMIIAMLAILKAGGAYLPIDPEYPQERKKYMLADSNAKLLVTTGGLSENRKIGRWEGKVVSLGNTGNSPLVRGGQKGRGVSNLSTLPSIHPSNPLNLAYIIYTSGSTGRPKGVPVQHQNVVRLAKNSNFIAFTPDDRLLLTGSFVFDITTFEIWWPLLNGLRLLLANRGIILDAEQLGIHLARNNISILHLTPQLFNQLASQHIEIFAGLKYFLVGGDLVRLQYVNVLRNTFNHIKILHMYGPTENTTFSTFHLVNRHYETAIPIGKPISNTSVYILDKWYRLVPPGVQGELCLGGDGIARGYLNNPELAAAKFDYDFWDYQDYHDEEKKDFNKKLLRGVQGGGFLEKSPPGRRRQNLYRTGDLARWLPDGNIQFLGRSDHQVKIRGFRIELEEIENRLIKHPDIKEAVILPDDNHLHLHAYIVLKTGIDAENFTASQLRDYLSTRLPPYMIPSHFIVIHHIPVTNTGKIDLKTLRQIEKTSTDTGSAYSYAKTRNQLEEKIKNTWTEILGIEKIGIHDNFFDRGGNSLDMIKLSSLLKKVLKVKIPTITLFRFPTISSLALYLNKGSQEVKTAGSKEKPIASEILGPDFDTAVIGMSGRFPGARNIEEFWNNLKNGIESISFLSDQDLKDAGVPGVLLQNPDYVRGVGLLENRDSFDADFFGYIPDETVLMDPQIRLFHEVTWEALENAGYNPDNYQGDIGLYAAATHNLEWSIRAILSEAGRTIGQFQLSQLTNKDALPTRVAYKLNLKGPAVSIQTACSSSLTAIHMARTALMTGGCDMAAAGGISLFPGKITGNLYQEGLIASPDGHCRSFDARAQGTVGGEGIAVVVLKRLKDARTDGDTIYALIKGSAANNDGTLRAGYTAPGVEGQYQVIKKTLHQARINPETITYIETHGTATSLGDPIEIQALTLAFNTTRKNYCAIGSVKTNFGHLDSAAGAAGFIKTVLALKHKMIPPSLHFESPNPTIDIANSPFYVNTGLKHWKPNHYPLRAGISSFGIGGTNVHIILQEPPEVDEITPPWKKHRLILLSARTPLALQQARKNHENFFRENPHIDIDDAAYTLEVGRKAFQHRAMMVASSVKEAAEILHNHNMTIHQVTVEKPNLIFMFSGQGAQYVNMGLELYQKEPVFRREMNRCFEILKPLIQYDIKEILYPSPITHQPSPDINRTEVAQPVILAFEYSLAQLLMHWGISPDGLLGYSFGEYAAACLSGIFSLEDALGLVVLRGQLMQHMPSGAMLSVPLPEKELKPLLPQNLSIAIINEPACIVAGPPEAIENFEKQMKQQRLMCMKINAAFAPHSSLMNSARETFEQYLKKIQLHQPQIPLISGITGQWLTPEDAVDYRYWSRHLRETIRFSKGIRQLVKGKPTVFIEIGPGRDLTVLARRYIENTPRHRVVNTIRPSQEESADFPYLLRKIGQLWLYGITPDWKSFYKEEKRKRIALPTYPFQGRKFHMESSMMESAARFLEQLFQDEKKPDILNWFNIPQKVEQNKKETAKDSPGVLPPLMNQRPVLSTFYTAPTTEMEQVLIHMWEHFFGMGKIGIHDDFFELGGDSLKAMNLLTRIQRQLHVQLPLPEFFKISTVGKLAAYIERISQTNTRTMKKKQQGLSPFPEAALNRSYLPIKPAEKKSCYPLSSLQKRLFILQQIKGVGTAYHLPYILIAQGLLKKSKLEKAFQQLIQRHESLRTSFELIKNDVVQRVHPHQHIEFALKYYEAPQVEPGDKKIQHIIKKFIKPFDLNRAPLLKVGLIRCTREKHLVLFDIHHIISDGTSMGNLVRDVVSFYNANPMPRLRVQYKEFALWQNSSRGQTLIKEQEIYWLKRFKGKIPRLSIYTDYKRPAAQRFEGNSIDFSLEKEIKQRIDQMKQETGTTLYMVLLTVFTILLSKYSRQEDIVVGTPIAGRQHLEFENIIGLFINALPMRNFPTATKTFLQFLQEVKENTLQAFQNQQYPFGDLLKKLGLMKEINRNPLFDVELAVQNLETWEVQIQNLRFAPYKLFTPKVSQVDMTFNVFETNETIQVNLIYCTALFKPETMQRLINSFKEILSAVLENRDIQLKDIHILHDLDRIESNQYHDKTMEFDF